ncbi:hypothetical protein AB0B50_20100 [Streptomyces sp. NPDC041068]|uniref:hypothetical protein n=1 Tax=Streptomyces sp. NPDC041068 TaxID=3155130 RepID=UPI00340DB1E5
MTWTCGRTPRRPRTHDPRWLLHEQDDDGDEKFHVFRVDLETPDAEAVDVTPFPGATIAGFELVTTRPGMALLHLNQRNPVDFDPHELDITTGELMMLAQNPGQVGGWLQPQQRPHPPGPARPGHR